MDSFLNLKLLAVAGINMHLCKDDKGLAIIFGNDLQNEILKFTLFCDCLGNENYCDTNVINFTPNSCLVTHAAQYTLFKHGLYNTLVKFTVYNDISKNTNEFCNFLIDNFAEKFGEDSLTYLTTSIAHHGLLDLLKKLVNLEYARFDENQYHAYSRIIKYGHIHMIDYMITMQKFMDYVRSGRALSSVAFTEDTEMFDRIYSLHNINLNVILNSICLYADISCEIMVPHILNQYNIYPTHKNCINLRKRGFFHVFHFAFGKLTAFEYSNLITSAVMNNDFGLVDIASAYITPATLYSAHIQSSVKMIKYLKTYLEYNYSEDDHLLTIFTCINCTQFTVIEYVLSLGVPRKILKHILLLMCQKGGNPKIIDHILHDYKIYPTKKMINLAKDNNFTNIIRLLKLYRTTKQWFRF